jgi:methenyltetrahydromethanopterin cyclohydrolase
MLSVNRRALQLIEKAIERKEELRIEVTAGPLGCTIIDAGVRAIGGYEAGKVVTEICLGGYGSASITWMNYVGLTLPSIFVRTDHPAIATLGSQFAGWAIKTADYIAMGSGPARALSKKPKEIYEQIEYEDRYDSAVIILEADSLPTEEAVKVIAEKCGISPKNLYVVVAPTSSVVGSTQISGRIVEMGIHKLSKVGLDPKLIQYGCGYAPIAPVHPKAVNAMGRTNDALYYGGVTFYTVTYESDDQLRSIVSKSPSCASKSYGKPFHEIFKEAEFDFYKIDPEIFAPAVVSVSNIKTGATFRSGEINVEVLRRTLGVITVQSGRDAA